MQTASVYDSDVTETEDEPESTPRITADLTVAVKHAKDTGLRLDRLLRRLRGDKPVPVEAKPSETNVTPSVMQLADMVRIKNSGMARLLDEIEKLV